MSSKNSPTRKKIFEEASKKLKQDFEHIQNLPHNGESGREAENILKKFLNSHLPKRFAAVSGFIIDDADNVSSQCDVIIYDANSSPVLETYDDNYIIPADNAAAVIEIKSTLRTRDIYDAAEKIAKIKIMQKSKIKAEPPHNLFTIGITFAFDSELSLKRITEHHAKAAKNNSPGLHIDYIFVVNLGMVALFLHPENEARPAPILLYPNAKPHMNAVFLSGYVEYQEKVLDAFMRFLLAHLTFFHPHIAHPGFDLTPSIDASSDSAGIMVVGASAQNETVVAKMMSRYKDSQFPKTKSSR